MARKLVEYSEVADAAQKLKNAGKHPSVIAVRSLMGKGSFTTVSTYLKQWLETQVLAEEPPKEALPESVMIDGTLFLQKIYAVAKVSTDEQLERERAALRQKELAFQEDMQQAVDMANEATEKAELLEEQLEALSHKKVEVDSALSQSERALSLKTAQLERSETDTAKLEKRVAELESKLEAKAADLAQSQQSLAAAKAQNESSSRECHRLSGEVENLQERLANADAETRALLQEKGVIVGQLREREQQSKKLAQQLDVAIRKISLLEQSVDGSKKAEKR